MRDSSWLNLKPFNDYQINKYLVLVSVSITIFGDFIEQSTLLSSQATHRFNTSTTLSRSLTVERSFMLFSSLPRSRGNSINYTSVSFAMQIRFPWFAPQCFFPKLFQHHPSATRNSFKQETKTLYNWKPVKPLLTRRNTEEVLRFFLLAAATHTTIQTPKHPCNPKKGEVGHKKGFERVSNTLPDTKTPSQGVLEVLKNLQKTSKKPHKRRRNHSNPRRKPSKSLSVVPIPTSHTPLPHR